MHVDYLLHESSVGYAVCFFYPPARSVTPLTSLQVFKLAMQADTIGNRLKEVQDKVQNLATFGNMPHMPIL
jgi:nucleolar protein 56